MMMVCGGCGRMQGEDGEAKSAFIMCSHCSVQEHCSEHCWISNQRQHITVCHRINRQRSMFVDVIDMIRHHLGNDWWNFTPSAKRFKSIIEESEK